MADKQKIFDNVAQYTPEQLSDYIEQGVFSFDELKKGADGELDHKTLKEIKELLKNRPNPDDSAYEKVQEERSIEKCQDYLNKFPAGKHRDEVRKIMDQIEKDKQVRSEWESVDKGDKKALEDFIGKFPGSSYAEEAKQLLEGDERDEMISELLVNRIHELQALHKLPEEISDEIVKIIKGGNISKDDLLKVLSDDHNFLSSHTVRDLIKAKRIISPKDLLYNGIDQVFIKKMMKGDDVVKINSTPDPFDKVKRQSTEVYFWGMPSSGKSCALGAILSVADDGEIATLDPDPNAQGYGYMSQLMSFFRKGDVGPLVRGTSIDSFFEMGFSLIEKDGKKEHPITCVDMAGELMKCLYKKNAGVPMDDSEVIMLDTLRKILIDNSSDNRKIHFFVVEYGADDRLTDGLTQKIYLDGAMAYLKNLKIFEKSTDAIYIIITKVDKAKGAVRTKEALREYIRDKYRGFYKKAEQICKDNEINGGNLEMLAFTLGDVCFQDFCKFDGVAAENVVRKIMGRSASFKRGKWAKILKGIKE